MPYDEGLAARIEERLERLGVDAYEVKKMFGGVGYMLRGNMACGVHRDRLIVRVGPARYAAALGRPHVAEFDITGRPMSGWVSVGEGGYEDDQDLERWVAAGVELARSLPAK